MIDGFLPRGALGFGSLRPGLNSLIGRGFIDAYQAAEQRDPAIKDVCAVLVTAEFLRVMPNTKQNWKILCFYRGYFFINPIFLTDPQMGVFDRNRILKLLKNGGVNIEKHAATEQFLNEFESYDEALEPQSKSRSWLQKYGAITFPDR
ncbi:MAG: hypothetical protein NVS3B3_23730 [Aquirhabdus sp.]